MNRREALAAVLGVAGVATWQTASVARDHYEPDHAGREEGFVDIFNGQNWDGLERFLDPKADDADKDETWKIDNRTIICSGYPNGYLRTKREYKNFILRFEYRTPAAGNSGVFLMKTPDKIWPRGVEVQLWSREVGTVFGVGGGTVDGGTVLQSPARIGEWNRFEIVHHQGFVASVINGHLVAVGTNPEPDQGHLMWQSEGAEIHFRYMRVRELE